MKVFAGLVALALVMGGCRGEVQPDRLSAEEVAFGRFDLIGGRPALTGQGSRIACVPDVRFGVDYRVEAEGLRFGGTLPIEFLWRHPELAVPSEKLWGDETVARRPRPVLRWGESSLEGRALWQLVHPDERKDGRYEFLIRVIGSGRVLLSRVFEVEGC